MANISTTPSPVARSAAAAKPRLWASRKGQDQIIRVLATVICIVGAIIILFPIGWMLSTSLKTRVESIQIPPTVFPDVPQWDNYYQALVTIAPFGRYFLNTMFYAISVMIAEMVSCSFIAYGFARLRAPGKNVLFLLVLATMMMPGWVTLIPQYILFSKLGWLNSYRPLIIPHLFGSAYLIFLLRQFYKTLPKDYEEAAIIDGANYLGIWLRIFIPLSLPALGAVAILSFMFHYQDYNGPLIYINDQLKYPVSIGLQQFQAPFGGTAFNLLMAASIATIIPPVIVFFIAQRYFIQGIVVSGVKG
ncbi:MAG TPA: carbohydrate ABC transporter permease [Roseiflexaceae bacterium]|nr:carbohydrate ABC transporter permease [Roseiflexaceae bacterium]